MSDVEHPVPVTDAEKHVNDVMDDLAARRVSAPDRARLRGAVDKADMPPTGRPAQDAALGRISRKG